MGLALEPHTALIYEYVEDVLEARKPFREAHLDAARAARDTGFLAAGGALGDPPHGGLLVFTGGDLDAVRRFAEADPYVLNGVVTSWRVEPWNVVV